MEPTLYVPKRAPEELPLFAAPPLTATADHASSEAAADRIAPHVTQLRAEILAVVQAAGDHGITDKELEQLPQFASLAPSSARKRRSELLKLGLVQPRGLDRRDGCTVWIARRPIG